MKIVVPYTIVHNPTRDAVKVWPGGVQWEFVGDTSDDYLHLLARLFIVGDPFILCEHDVVPGVDELTALDACPREWCAYLYRDEQRQIGPPLGCCRFRETFLTRNRDLFGTFDTNLREEPSWGWLNQWFNKHAVGVPHLHGPPYVRHDKQRERALADSVVIW